MAATVTATGSVGPGLTLTAGVFTDISECTFGTANNILTLYQSTTGKFINVDISAATTITATKSGSTYTFTIS